MEHVFTREEINICDKNMIKNGCTEQELIQRAAKVLAEKISPLLPARVLFLCGYGNNGKDGIELCRLLGCGKIYSRLSDLNEEYDIYIDCIFGTGLTRLVEGEWKTVIERVNQKKGKKLAIDIPSGLNCDSGQTMGACFIADMTYTFVGYKYGQLLGKGRDVCGNIEILDIGIDNCIEKCGYVSNGEELASCFQQRKTDCHKGVFGRCLIVAGSKGYFGAGKLSASAEIALRCGVGYCYLATEKSLFSDYRKCLPEAILLSNANKLPACNCVVAGMGMATGRIARRTVSRLLDTAERLVLDADALNLLSGMKERLKKRQKGSTLITPHLKEFSTLLGVAIEKVKEQPLQLAKAFAREFGVVVILKGATTIITDGERVCLNVWGSPALAKSGSGDVLSGVLGAILSRCEDVFNGAVASCLLFGKSGERAAKRFGEYSVLASDVVEEIKRINDENV